MHYRVEVDVNAVSGLVRQWNLVVRDDNGDIEQVDVHRLPFELELERVAAEVTRELYERGVRLGSVCLPGCDCVPRT